MGVYKIYKNLERVLIIESAQEIRCRLIRWAAIRFHGIGS